MITGPAQVADGASFPGRVGRFGETFTNVSVGEYFEMAKQGRLFSASMQAGAALGTALTTTAVTWTLYNPAGSGCYLSLLHTTVCGTSNENATATGQIVVYGGNFDPSAALPATNTQIVTRSALLGGNSNSVGKVFSATTLPATPVVVRVHPFGYNAFTTYAAGGGFAVQDFVLGAITLAPNTAVTLQGIAATTGIAGVISGTWAEIPM